MNAEHAPLRSPAAAVGGRHGKEQRSGRLRYSEGAECSLQLRGRGRADDVSLCSYCYGHPGSRRASIDIAQAGCARNGASIPFLASTSRRCACWPVGGFLKALVRIRRWRIGDSHLELRYAPRWRRRASRPRCLASSAPDAGPPPPYGPSAVPPGRRYRYARPTAAYSESKIPCSLSRTYGPCVKSPHHGGLPSFGRWT